MRPRASLRTRLSVESLDYRATPSTLDGTDDSPETRLGEVAITGDVTPAAVSPTITAFSGAEVELGWWRFSGTVTDNSPGGITVSFGGIPALTDKSAVTDSAGNFTILVRVDTTGLDSGTATAVATDSDSNVSNTAMYDVSPTLG